MRENSKKIFLERNFMIKEVSRMAKDIHEKMLAKKTETEKKFSKILMEFTEATGLVVERVDIELMTKVHDKHGYYGEYNVELDAILRG